MKRILGLVVCIALVCVAAMAWAVESCSVSTTRVSQRDIGQVTTWTLVTAADGSFTACDAGATTATNPMASQQYGAIIAVETDPSGTNPTAGYDITIVDSSGNDVMGGALADAADALSETAVERRAPQLVGDTSWVGPFYGPLTLDVTNNVVDSATLTVKVYWEKW